MMDSDRSTTKVAPFEAARSLHKPPDAARHEWAALVEAVACRQDRDCFLRIYDHFSPRVRRYLLGLGGNAGLAEELAQEALLRVWQRAGQYDAERSSLSTWLFRIARNLYIDRVRKEPVWSQTQEYLEEMDLDGPADAGERPGTESLSEEANIHRAIAQLPAVQARLIRMSYFEAKSHQAIASELAMPLGTVKSHLRRAFLTLQNELRCER
ncbi:sigma-70 family RNA polymerase sigma factor [Frateuria terrea]|uniref:RNA polymerase sigma factor n=1 Tax=Frateuria terrea TaxID=529704 RepID=A0A1H6UD49_9GAMM|nr:RNA polymerase sigma-70 factor, ECF subfamily [Frateuria terrea]SFP36579.1 RNA polymerase sigma-70 factor, ECF subfamily [Frateuria terrea]